MSLIIRKRGIQQLLCLSRSPPVRKNKMVTTILGFNMKKALIPGLCFLILINGSCSYKGKGSALENIQRLNGEYNLENHPYKQYEDLTPSQESTIGKKTILDKHHKDFSTADGKRRNHGKPKNELELTRRASLLDQGKNHSQAHTVMPTSNVLMPLGWIPWPDATTAKEPPASPVEAIQHDGNSGVAHQQSKEEATPNQAPSNKEKTSPWHRGKEKPGTYLTNHSAPHHVKGHSKILHIVFPTSNVRIPLQWVPWVGEESPKPNNHIPYGSTKPAQLDRQEVNPFKEKPIDVDPEMTLNRKQSSTAERSDISLHRRIENILVPSKGVTSKNSVLNVPDQSKSAPYKDKGSGQKENITSHFMTRQNTPSIDETEGPQVPNSRIVGRIQNSSDQSTTTPYKEKGSEQKENISSNFMTRQNTPSIDKTEGLKVQNSRIVGRIHNSSDQSKFTPYKDKGSGQKENISSNFMRRQNTPSIHKTEDLKVQNSRIVDRIPNISGRSKPTPHTDTGSHQKKNKLRKPKKRHIRQQLPGTDNAKGRKVQVTGPINMHVPDQPKSTSFGNTEAQSGQKKNISTNPMPRITVQKLYNPRKDSVKGQKVQVTGPIRVLQVPDQSKSTPYAPVEKGSGLNGKKLISLMTNKETFGHEKTVSEVKTTKPNNTRSRPHNHPQNGSIFAKKAKNPEESRVRKLINGFLTVIKDAAAGTLGSAVKKIKSTMKGYGPKKGTNNMHYIQPNNTQGQNSFAQNGSISAPIKKPQERLIRRLINGFLRRIIRIKPVRKIKSSQLNSTQKHQGPTFTASQLNSTQKPQGPIFTSSQLKSTQKHQGPILTSSQVKSTQKQQGPISTNKAKNPKESRIRKLINGFLTGIKDAAAGVLGSTVKKIMGIVKGYGPKRETNNNHYIQPNNTQGQNSSAQNGSISAPTKKPRERIVRRLINGFLRGIRINPVRKIMPSRLNSTQKRQRPIFTSSQLNSTWKHQGPKFRTTTKPRKRRMRALIEGFLTGIKSIATGAWSRKT